MKSIQQLKPHMKISANKLNLLKWFDKGQSLPICINDGCNKPVQIRHWSVQGDPSLKTECGRCYTARLKNKIVNGITFHKKNYCENSDGMLGFLCPMDKSRYDEFPADIYHLDHLDGNHYNNIKDNLKTFCVLCHTRKGHVSGDLKSAFT